MCVSPTLNPRVGLEILGDLNLCVRDSSSIIRTSIIYEYLSIIRKIISLQDFQLNVKLHHTLAHDQNIISHVWN